MIFSRFRAIEHFIDAFVYKSNKHIAKNNESLHRNAL